MLLEPPQLLAPERVRAIVRAQLEQLEPRELRRDLVAGPGAPGPHHPPRPAALLGGTRH